ncbi:hypothetical protein COLO4_07406 [Corchorus olitorius]|uniref:Uncharacterized protein n=1 Tax=Corchorus olitorius TaxID=93759 RepID=A0A1R3KJY7_9ROSI|nr:hypothetical protein COLO4_07406 [Corchorus olitorius]
MEKVSPEFVLNEAAFKVKIKKVPKNFDLNVHADCGFDLNKFPVEGNEVFADKESQERRFSLPKPNPKTRRLFLFTNATMAFPWFRALMTRTEKAELAG